ncbi:hypothetical protein LOS25_16975 [Enterococcus faecium]|nr:hypothetical protein [Enterococcus faecium]
MRRIEKEFNKKLAGYERELKKLGCLDDETGLIPISKDDGMSFGGNLLHLQNNREILSINAR